MCGGIDLGGEAVSYRFVIDLGGEDDGTAPYVRDVHVRIVSSFRCLKRLSLAFCDGVTDASPLAFLKSLEELDLLDTEITDQSLRAISTSLI